MNAKERLIEILTSFFHDEKPPIEYLNSIVDRIASEGLLAAEQTNADDEPSPINACIRAAKRVITALNLPEGAGVAWDEDGTWFVYLEKPVVTLTTYGGIWDCKAIAVSALPKTAIPPWPGDWRKSWITATTPEITDETNK